MNHLTDKTDEERNSMRGYSKSIAKRWSHNREEGYNYQKSDSKVELPTQVDWRTKNVLTAVKGKVK